MGQRHQLFVIARINGRYRTLCDREDSLLPEDDSKQENCEGNIIYFPFTGSCLTLGACFGLDGYHHGVSIEPFYMYFDRGDNNNNNASKNDNLVDTVDAVSTISLRESSMESLLQALVKPTGGYLVLLSSLELLPDLLPRLKRRLYDTASRLEFTPTMVDVLIKLLEKDVNADLSPFTNFSASELSILVRALRDRSNMEGLNLSNRASFTESELGTILGPDQVYKRLYLLRNPMISVEYLAAQKFDFSLQYLVDPGGCRISIKESEWTVIVIHHAYDGLIWPVKADEDDETKDTRETIRALKKVRCVFVTYTVNLDSQQKRFRIADAPTYTRPVLDKNEKARAEADPLIDVWNQRFPTIMCQFYDEDDIYDILGMVYPPQERECTLGPEQS
ncbi:MAG: hypothetical protein Q9218_005927 [Villophora microphyllina]